MKLSLNQPNYLDLIFQQKIKKSDISFSDKKKKVYFSNLISLEDMLRNNNESNEVINCMSEFILFPNIIINSIFLKHTKIK